MTDQFDDRAKRRTQTAARIVLYLAASAAFATQAPARGFNIGPLIQVPKDSDPLAAATRVSDRPAT